DGACTADTVFAANMGASEPQLVAQAIGERHARLDVHADLLAVDLKCRRHACHLAIAAFIARSVSVPVSARRYAALAWISSCGSTSAAVASPTLIASSSSTALPFSAASAFGRRR